MASDLTPPDMKTGRSMRTCQSRGVPADHEARSQVKVREKSSTAGKKPLTGPQTMSRQNSEMGTPAQPCKRHSSATAPQHNSATVQETQQKKEERTQQIASVIENLTPSVEAMTQRSWRTDQTERTRYLIWYCCSVSKTR